MVKGQLRTGVRLGQCCCLIRVALTSPGLYINSLSIWTMVRYVS